MKNPISLKILFLLTQISYWGLIVIIALVVFAGTVMLALDPQLMELGFAFDLSHVEEVIYLNSDEGTPVEVEFFAESINIPVKHMNRLTMLYVLGMALLWLFCTLFIARCFKRFMRKVLNGHIFRVESINLLKQAALGFLIIEGIDFIAATVGHFYVLNHFDLGDFEHNFSWPFPSTALILSLTLWSLAHIIMKGKELEDEQKLTV